MAEALKEVYIPEGNMDLMRKAAGGSAQDIKMKDGKLKIDMFTASAIMQIFEKVNKANQKKMETMINSGRKADIVKLSNFAMSKINSEYIPEEKHQVRQLKDPKKEMMIKSKDSGVFVIDKKDFKKYQKKGFFQVEEVELDEAKYLEIDFKDKSTAAKAYDYINNEIWAGGNPPYDDFNQEGNSLQIDHSGNSKDLLDDLKDPKFGLPRNMKFKVAVDESLEEKRVDPADIDMDATDDDIKSADKNIMMQMRKVQSLRGNYAVEFMDGKKVKLPPKIALAVQDKYMKMRRPAEKEKFQSKVAKSYKDMLSALKESLVQEGTWHIAKGGDVKKLKKLMQKPIILGKDGDAAVEAIAPYIGDDELYDDLYDAGKKDGPKADARPLIKAAMKRLGIKEEVELDEKKTITLVKNKQPTAYDRMRRRMNPQDRKTVDASDKKQIKDLESRGWHRSPYDEAYEIGTDEYRKYLETLTPMEGARRDAYRDMKKSGELDRKDDEDDVRATKDDRKAANKNILQQLKKTIDTKRKSDIEFLDKKKNKVPYKVAVEVIKKYMGMRRSTDKLKFQQKVAKSYKDMLAALKENYELPKTHKETILDRIDAKIQERKNG